MTPSLIQKKPYRSDWQTLMPTFHFFIFAVWLPHASSLPKVCLCFKVRELCSSLNVVIHSFCLTNIRSKPWANSWSAFFSFSYVFGLHNRSFDLSVVNEEPTLAMGTFSFGIVVFLKFGSFGVSFSCFGISTFVLDGSLISVGSSKSSNISSLSLISSWTLDLSEVQFSVRWPGFLPW